MRHRKEGRKLSRTASHRRALLSSLSTALIKHKKIKTTVAKAKETRRIVEPLITRARNAFLQEKEGGPKNVSARREVAKFIRDREAVKTLFAEIAEKVGTRPGGFTRVVKLGQRYGDGAEMAVLELVDYNIAQESATKRKQRAARSKAAQAKKSAKVEEETEASEEVEQKKTRRGRKKKTESTVDQEPVAEHPDQPSDTTEEPTGEAAPAGDDSAAAMDLDSATGDSGKETKE